MKTEETKASLLQNRLLSDARVKSGVDLIAEERQRQVQVEGYTSAYDSIHKDGELFLAATSYLDAPDVIGVPLQWPWDLEFYKPTPNDRVRELVKAGALLAAEIDRLNSAHLINEASK